MIHPASELHGVLVVDKGQGPTSHDVVGLARRVLGTREIGHTGTLDPMATGVLVLVVGEATKLVNSLSAKHKRYRATVRLGSATTTLDAEGEVVHTAPVPALSLAEVEAAASAFLGEIEQRAPLVSAIKVAGTSLHKRVRRGDLVEAPLRRVRVDALEVTALRGDEIDLDVRSGPGFYVRSLARDLAERLGTVGHLSALRRNENGPFVLDGATTFDALREAKQQPELAAEIRARLIPLREVCRTLPNIVLDESAIAHARHGRPVPRPDALAAELGSLVALDSLGYPVALVEVLPDSLRVLRGFRIGR